MESDNERNVHSCSLLSQDFPEYFVKPTAFWRAHEMSLSFLLVLDKYVR